MTWLFLPPITFPSITTIHPLHLLHLESLWQLVRQTILIPISVIILTREWGAYFTQPSLILLHKHIINSNNNQWCQCRCILLPCITWMQDQDLLLMSCTWRHPQETCLPVLLSLNRCRPFLPLTWQSCHLHRQDILLLRHHPQNFFPWHPVHTLLFLFKWHPTLTQESSCLTRIRSLSNSLRCILSHQWLINPSVHIWHHQHLQLLTLFHQNSHQSLMIDN